MGLYAETENVMPVLRWALIELPHGYTLDIGATWQEPPETP